MVDESDDEDERDDDYEDFFESDSGVDNYEFEHLKEKVNGLESQLEELESQFNSSSSDNRTSFFICLAWLLILTIYIGYKLS